MKRSLSAAGILVAVGLVFGGTHIQAYLKLGTRIGSEVRPLRWAEQPIRYYVESRDVPTVTAMDLQGAVGRAFATWAKVPGVSISSQFGGFTDALPFDADGMSVIGFRSRPELDRTLGATTFTVDNITGELLESDVFLNTAFDWSVAAAGQIGRFDVESIALHEIGHFLGLSHSALGETELTDDGRRRLLAKGAVMFPIAFPPGGVRDRVLNPDDIAGLSDLYGSETDLGTLGSLGGRVTLNGVGLFGVHVVALNLASGNLVSSFTLDDNGSFVVSGLEPGVYAVRAEPLDDADVASFFTDGHTVNVNFRPAYSTKLASVPAGGGAQALEIKVAAK